MGSGASTDKRHPSSRPRTSADDAAPLLPQGGRRESSTNGKKVELSSMAIEEAMAALNLSVSHLSTRNAELAAQLRDRNAELKVFAIRAPSAGSRGEPIRTLSLSQVFCTTLLVAFP